MATQKFTDMRSVSFTKEQGEALDKQAQKEDRKAGNLIRRAVVEYLNNIGALSAKGDTDDTGDDE